MLLIKWVWLKFGDMVKVLWSIDVKAELILVLSQQFILKGISPRENTPSVA